MKMNNVIKYIGVTGLPGSGKGEFIRILGEILTKHGIDLRYYSLSDELRDEARRRSLAVERPVLRSVANELRLKFGGGILSSMLCKKISQAIASDPPHARTVIIIDAIRTPDEVSELRSQLGGNFVLTALEAPLETLIERVSGRARFDERTEVIEGKAAARSMILREAGQDEPDHGHNIEACITMADYHVDNSRTLDCLSLQVAHLADTIVLPHCNLPTK